MTYVCTGLEHQKLQIVAMGIGCMDSVICHAHIDLFDPHYIFGVGGIVGISYCGLMPVSNSIALRYALCSSVRHSIPISDDVWGLRTAIVHVRHILKFRDGALHLGPDLIHRPP